MLLKKKFIIDNWSKLLLSFPIGLYFTGIIIKNIYLLQYGIIDFNPFQMDIFYSGFVFMLLIYFHIFYLNHSGKFIINDYKKIKLAKNVYYTIILCNVELVFFNSYLNDANIHNLLINKNNYIEWLFRVVVVSSAYYLFLNDLKIKYLLEKIIFNILKIILPTLNIAFLILILIYVKDSYIIVIFSLTISNGYILLKDFINRNLREQRESESSDKERFSIMKVKSLINFLFIIFVILFFVILTYSNTIYSKIPRNFGGAKPISIKTIDEEGNIIHGNLVHQNNDKLFIKNMDKIKAINSDSEYDLLDISDKPFLFTRIITE